MERPEDRIVGWILEPSPQNRCESCDEQPATVEVALSGDLTQVIRQCGSCVQATDEIAEIFAAALTRRPACEA